MKTMAKKEDFKIGAIIVVGVVAGLILIVLVIGVQGWFLDEIHRETARKWDDIPIRWLTDLQAGQQEKIGSYRWMDRSKRIVAIPIDDAIKRLIENGGKLPATQPATK